MPHDVRSIANFVLDQADSRALSLSNMQINKIVYFLHAEYLVSHGNPLVSAKIEAWQHGPVFRELYREFKSFADQAITSRAGSINPLSGTKEISTYCLTGPESAFLEKLVDRYAAMSAAALRAQSHVEGGPWDLVWNHEAEVNASMRITDDIILNWYRSAGRH